VEGRGEDLDTPVPRLPLWDVFPASLHELQLRDDGAEMIRYVPYTVSSQLSAF
jgi:hypothetical protein